ncbi:hypothetical protein ACFQ4N_12880 [Oceanobacillus iheyensis]|uniref:hypothetical protein n=1 Tax=Oceanobacillus iheyensis TaxID=182710 RepID=UPI00362BEEB1
MSGNKNHSFDEQLKKLFHEKTDIATTAKEETWIAIHQTLENDTEWKKRKKKQQRRRVMYGGITFATIIAIVILVWSTDVGKAMLQDFISLFEEEREETIHIEGHEERVDVNVKTNEELKYAIYIDEERYKMTKGEDVDRIETKEPLGDRFPEVYMEIERVENTTKEEVITSIQEEINEDENLILDETSEVTEPIEATLLKAKGLPYTNEFGKTGDQWDTPIHKYYVTDDYQGQVFIIKQVYFLEAAEGHGARFYYMLESFQVITNPEE